MDQRRLCTSLMKWMQTFNLQSPCTTAEELSDGVAMANVLAQIAPEYFDSQWMTKIKTEVTTNLWLKVSNLKKIQRGIAGYYMEVLGQQIIDFRTPDVNAIGEHNDVAELGRLLQLILGCAVKCDHKEEYIQTIMGMEEDVQHVVMNAIQELMTKETPSTVLHNDTYGVTNDQVRRLMDELHTMTEAKEQIGQRCHELDLQVTGLQEEKSCLLSENERLTEKLTHAENLDDIGSTNPFGRRNQTLQHQVDQLQEELYKIESSRDEYRSKVDDLESEVKDLQEKNEELQRVAEEAQLLKDEVDILRETRDKVAKYESTLETYKKKLEDLGDLKRQLKLLEEKNTAYMHQNMELEEEIKKSATLRTQLEMYKKQVQEMHSRLSEGTKKADKAEFERNKLCEKLTAIEREKERLISERDMLRETNEELKLAQLHIESTSSHDNANHTTTVSGDVETFEMIPPELKERLIRLQHENRMLKLNRRGSDEEQIQVLQTMVDDTKERQSELETENRLANQRILELESQLEEFHAGRAAANSHEGAELRQKLNVAVNHVREFEAELGKRNADLEQRDATVAELGDIVKHLRDCLTRKDDEINDMEERYKKHLEKAKSVMKNLDVKPSFSNSSSDIAGLRNQLHEKDKYIENLEKEKEFRNQKDAEEKLILAAFHNQAPHRRAVKERLAANVIVGQSFLARQRQASSRRTGIGQGSSDFFD